MRPLQREIIEALRVQPEIDVNAEIERSVQFLVDYMQAHPGLETYVLGISGGQDSTLAGRLAQLAVERLREQNPSHPYRFIAVRLPYGTQLDEADAKQALAFIQPDQTMTVNIQPTTDALVGSLGQVAQGISDFNKGNIKARMRMVAQYAIAGDNRGVVIGTDHASESVTGFFTKFGDGACDILPLWRLTKFQGRELLEALGAPASLYEKVPTADLEDDQPMLPDEEALGVTYEAIDAYLRGQSVSLEAAEVIESWYLKTQHKRHLPITVFDTFWR